jgi:hypothetical protein
MPRESGSMAERRAQRWQRCLMNALAIFIIYGNLSVTFQPKRVGLPQLPGLPCPVALRDAFLIPGMFSSYLPLNFDHVLQGERLRRDGSRDPGAWITLSLSEHFPLRPSMTLVHLLAAHHRDMLGAAGQRQAWALYAEKIKDRHNRLHPDAKVGRVRIAAESFPQSPKGYRAGKNAATTSFQVWFEAP